jgi:shikimate kinase
MTAIVLIGFMGAGKTTVARALAERLGCAWLDLDGLITERTGRTPAQIIDQQGESRFRQEESAALRQALREIRPGVMALGGGAWTVEANRELIARYGCRTVWLDAPFDLCFQRLTQQGDTRPLARDPARARQLYAARRPAYAQARATVTITQDMTAQQIVDKIMSSTL